jgi:hypothetical protein
MTIAAPAAVPDPIPPSTSDNFPQSWRLGYIITAIILGAVALGFIIAPLHNYAHSLSTVREGATKDYYVWYCTGLRELGRIDGGNIYKIQDDGTFEFMYPPATAALLAIPVATGRLGMMIILITLNTIAWAAAIFLSVFLITRKTLRQNPLLYLLPALFCTPFIWATYLLGQVNLFLLTVMLLGFLLLWKKPFWAGTLFALATAIKAFPFLILLYLVYRRCWVAIVGLFVGLIFLLVVLPLPFRGGAQTVADLNTWTHGMLLNNSAQGVGQRPQRTYLWKNQSMLATVTRLLRHVESERTKDTGKPPVFVNVLDVSPKEAAGAVLAVAAGLVGFFLIVTPKLPRGRPASPTEIAIVLLLMLMLSPYCFGYFFTWLLFPFTLLTQLILTTPKPVAKKWLVVTIVALLLLAMELPLPVVVWMRDVGNDCFACLLLALALGVWLYSRRGSAEPTVGAIAVGERVSS